MTHLLQRRGFVVFLIVALVFVLYSFMLSASFKTLDDTVSIVENPLVQDPARWGEIFTTSFFSKDAYYRPLVSLSFALEYRWFGAVPFFYYFDNLLLHTLTALLVYALFLRLLPSRLVAAVGALLFAVHPVQWEAVSNIPGRAILLNALFDTAAVLFFVRAAQGMLEKRGDYYLTLVAFGVSLFCKESAAIVPLLLAAYLYCFPADGERTPLRHYALVLPFVALTVAMITWRRSLGITELYLWRNPAEAALGFVTFLRGQLTYLRLLVLPLDLHFDRSLALYRGFAHPQLWSVIVIYLGAAAAAFHFRRRISRPAAFFAAWYLLALLPVSQFLVTIGVMPGVISLAEHFLYTPMVGAAAVMVLAAAAIGRLAARRKILSPSLLGVIAAAAVVFLMLVTVQQNIYSSQEIAMFERSIAMNPRNARIQYSLGRAYAEVERPDLAEQQFRGAVNAEPDNARHWIALGKSLVDQGRYWEALRIYQASPPPGAHAAILERNLSGLCAALIQQYRAILHEHPEHPGAHYSLGVVHSINHNPQAALRHYRRATELAPGHVQAWYNYASAADGLGRAAESRFAWRGAMRALLLKERLSEEEGLLRPLIARGLAGAVRGER